MIELPTESEPVRVVEGDALATMREVPDSCIDLILTDPPYFRVKDELWDNAWDTAHGFLAWVGDLCDEWRRLLKPNGSLYCFASTQMAGRVEAVIAGRFNVLNRLVWVKREGWHCKADPEAIRGYFPQTEYILFAEQFGASGFSPLGGAIRAARDAAGIRGADVDVALGNVRRKTPARGTELCRRWEEGSSLPTEEDFVRALRACGDPRADHDLRRQYHDLRRQYHDLRRPFFADQTKHHTDVWDYPTVAPYPGKHPCEKPRKMFRDIIRASSRPGGLVLDCFAGSGTAGAAAVCEDRRAILIEKEPQWADYARRRVREAMGTGLLAGVTP